VSVMRPDNCIYGTEPYIDTGLAIGHAQVLINCRSVRRWMGA